MDHSLLGTLGEEKLESYARYRKMIEVAKGEHKRARSWTCERGRVSFHENSCRSFEASSLVRASHLAESESPGRPCNDAQVHAEQDSLFASPVLRLLCYSLSPPFPPSTTTTTTVTTTVAVIIIGAAARQGRAPSPLPPSGFFGPLAPPPSCPSKTPQSRRQLLTSPLRTPSPPSSFPPSSFSHLLRLFVLPRRACSSPTPCSSS